MKRAFLLLVLATMLAAPVGAGVIVDHFVVTGNAGDNSILLTYNVFFFGDPSTPPTYTDSDSRTGTDAPAGQRDLVMRVIDDQNETSFTSVAISGPLNRAILDSADLVDAEMELSYGSLAFSGGPDTSLDMSGEDRFIFGIVGTVDVDAEVQFDLDTNSGAGSFSYTMLLPAGTGGGVTVFFSNFAGFAAASGDVDGIRITFRPQAGITDLDVTITGIVATTPEPGTMSLLALGGLGLLRRRRRKKR